MTNTITDRATNDVYQRVITLGQLRRFSRGLALWLADYDFGKLREEVSGSTNCGPDCLTSPEGRNPREGVVG